MKVLVDTNIEINAITHKTVLLPQVIKWGPHTQTIEVAQRAYFPPGDDERFRSEQLPFLATLCNLAKEEKLEFFTSHEILMEKVRQKGRCEGYFGINLFQDVPVKSVPCPIQRTIVFGISGGHGLTEKEQMEFFRSIKHSRFLQIRKAVGEAHIDDAFHFWTAEAALLDAFLTLDRRFWRVVNQKKKIINSSVLVLTPKELCERLDAHPTDIEKLAASINPFR